MRKYWTSLVLGLVVVAHADLQLNGIFTDNMVLQRNQQVPVWGTADPGAEVTVEFAGQKKTAIADSSNHWKITLDPMPASSNPRKLSVYSNSNNPTIQYSNLLVGDVWLCAGQSNMATLMRQYPLVWDQVKDGFQNDQIRLFKIKQGGVGSPEPTKEVVIDPGFKGSWQICSPEFSAEFSATAGFFGMKLQRDTGVPIGLLYAVRGGTQANMWMPREVLGANPDYARFLDAANGNWKPSKNNPDAIRAPSHLYNGTIHPLAPFALRGVIWYQGESDSQWPELYGPMMDDMVRSWRTLWGYDFPFLFVQLAPFKTLEWDQTGEAWAWLREVQLQGLETIPDSGMVVITDAGEKADIHPQAKKVAGERLAVLAASLDDRKVDAKFPTVGKMKVKDGRARIQFKGTSGGLEARRVALNTTKGHLPGKGPEAVVVEDDELKGFMICGEDRVFVEAVARILSKDVVEVSSAQVKKPVAVRYGWVNFPLCNLYGGNGMPATPFRTDDFPMPNLSGEILGESFTSVDAAWGAPLTILGGGDGKFQSLEIDGRNAWRAEGSYLYFQSAATEPASARVHMLYYDEGFATVQLRYDSTSEVWKPAGEVRYRNSKQWKVVAFDLPDARFSKRCNGGDIRLQSTGALVVGGIYSSNLQAGIDYRRGI